MQISMKTLMHTIKHMRFLCHYAKKTCSEEIKHLHESIVSQVSQILSNWQFVYMYKTEEIVWNSLVVVSLDKMELF